MNIVGISDVALGFGSPQILQFMHSFAMEYRATTTTVYEPTRATATADSAPPSFGPVARKQIDMGGLHVHSRSGRATYLGELTSRLNSETIDVLVCFCTFTLPIAVMLRKRPRIVIYYVIEMASIYGRVDQRLNAALNSVVDFLIFPEENRGAIEICKYGWKDIPSTVVFNAAKTKAQISSLFIPSKKNERFLYAGTIDPEMTFANLFLDPRLRELQFDLFGPLRFFKERQKDEFISALPPNVTYHGVVPATELEKIRLTYSYSLIMWNPKRVDQYYAAPNKFFESIAEGVPPITLPHPQAARLIRRFNCGLAADGWTAGDLVDKILFAKTLIGTSRYDAMVGACRDAAMTQLNWDEQYSRFNRAFQATGLLNRELGMI